MGLGQNLEKGIRGVFGKGGGSSDRRARGEGNTQKRKLLS